MSDFFFSVQSLANLRCADCVCVSYSEKAPLNQALKKEPNANVPDEFKDKEELQEKPSVADTQEEADALRIPPDPSIPTGILSVIIHQINNCTFFILCFM